VTKRLSSEDRRAQVVRAALRLLGEVPLEKLTTRLVAREVGTSQPALFRHFRSRDALLVAVVEEARSSMGRLAGRTLELDDPLVALKALVHGLFEFVAEHPGLPRLLFHDVTGHGEAPYHRPLRLMVSMQAALVGQLVRTAQERGAVHPAADPERAAFLLTALIQGVLARWQHGGRESDLRRDAADLIALWSAGVAAGAPARAEADESPPPAQLQALSSLDVRPLLAAGTDPLDAILAALGRVESGGVLEILVPFRPRPLLTLLAAKGHGVSDESLGADLVRVTIRRDDGAPLLDLRRLEAPEPMERILAASAELGPGDRLVARMPRVPKLLLPHLADRGLAWSVLESSDGTALLHLRSGEAGHED
jgi:AcrR family transcriptional regulator/uncharacterized protein (DUF2249 family)